MFFDHFGSCSVDIVNLYNFLADGINFLFQDFHHLLTRFIQVLVLIVIGLMKLFSLNYQFIFIVQFQLNFTDLRLELSLEWIDDLGVFFDCFTHSFKWIDVTFILFFYGLEFDYVFG